MHKLFLHFSFYLCLTLTALSCQSTTSSEVENTKEAPITTTTESSLNLEPCEPLIQEALYNNVLMQAYTYQNGKFMFGVEGVALGAKTPGAEKKESATSKKGNYIHIVLNDKDHHTSDYQHFIHELPDGEYTLLSFLSRSYHESIKTPTASISKTISIKNKQLQKSQNFDQAAIAINAPRGLYKNDDTKKVVLDFHLFNTNLSPEGNKVRVLIDQEEFILDQWQAHYINGLTLGMHTLELSLINSSGNVIYGPVSERFVLTEEPENS
ncbi:MAG: hypothetical protein GY810_27820 [Aureispira sp.]|nr:hypothetical protein [Aureispira sp.]